MSQQLTVRSNASLYSPPPAPRRPFSTSSQNKSPFFPEKVNYDIRKVFLVRNGSVYLYKSDFDPHRPHEYLAFNSLGFSKLSPRRIMARLMQDWNKFFPFGAKGSDGTNQVFPNQELRLGGPRLTIKHYTANLPFMGTIQFPLPSIGMGNFVRVTEVTAHTVTVVTEENHTFTGQVENGIFADLSGEVWMYQRGTGFDTASQRLLNYATAGGLWRWAAENVRGIIAEPTRPDSSNDPVEPPGKP